MSYSFTTRIIERWSEQSQDPAGSLDDAIDEAYAQFSQAGQEQNGTDIEARVAIETAKSAAWHIANGLGPYWSKIKVTIVGHANPGNVKTPGWSDEFCQVKVDVMEYTEPKA